MAYEEVTELRECRVREANQLLSEGWRLLDIQSTAMLIARPEDAQGMPQSHYMRRIPVFILGKVQGSPAP